MSIQDAGADRVKQLIEALTLAKGFMRHPDDCAETLILAALRGKPVECSCGYAEAEERVVLALPRPTVVVECGDTPK